MKTNRKKIFLEIVKDAIEEGWETAHTSEDVSASSIKESIFNSIKDKSEILFKQQTIIPKTRDPRLFPEDGC